tara:strand:+ start:1423 stop:2265 length:843 start_codon:yes stop_codon:yes gene_type:complete
MSLAMLTWGAAWTCAKISNEYLNYNNLVFLRFFIGFITIFPIALKQILNLSQISFKTYLNILITSILFFIYNQCFFMGTDIGRSGMGGVFVTTTNPIITLITASILNKKFNLLKGLAIILGFIGGLIILDVFNGGINRLLFAGNQYFIMCSIIWGIMTIIISKGQENINSLWYITFCYFVTSMISLFFIDLNQILDFKIYDIKFFINFFVVCSAMSFGTSIYMIGSYKLGPISASSFIFSVPIIAILTANIVINEPIGFNVIIGGTISIISIFIINYIIK